MTVTDSTQTIRVEANRCHGCLTCEYRCSLRACGAFNPSRANIQVSHIVGEYRYQHSFTDGCDGCDGEYLCVQWCPYGALHLERR